MMRVKGINNRLFQSSNGIIDVHDLTPAILLKMSIANQLVPGSKVSPVITVSSG